MEILIILILIIVLLIFYFNKSKFNENKFKNNGFAPDTADYIKPKVYPDFITLEENEHILSKAKDQFAESHIMGGFNTSIRKSKTAWLYKTDPIIYNILKRVTDLIDDNIENAEALQVVEYEAGGYYNEHHDSCCDDAEVCTTFVEKSGQRTATMLIYLNDNFEGGETEFLNLNLKLKAPKNGGILFRPLETGGNRCHPLALHKGCPILSGKKYICNVWIREAKW